MALATLFGPGAAFYTVTSTLTQPRFDGGTLLGQLDLQKGISAFTDVEKEWPHGAGLIA